MKHEARISDSFWNRYKELIKNEMIPYQWDVLNDKADISIENGEFPHSCQKDKRGALRMGVPGQ